MRDIGDKGEKIAVKKLKNLGYKILERNYNVPRTGEIDIVAMQGEYLVFAEVRLRKNAEYGAPAETVDAFKQRKLVKAALMYMKEKNLTSHSARFDVVSITGNPDGDYTVEVIRNAFDAK